jgi:uncharacterized integral membrane protein
MTTPIDPPPQQPMPNQPGVGPLDQPVGHEYRSSMTDPVPAQDVPDTTVSQAGSPAPGLDERGRVKSGRVSAAWVGSIGTAVFLILLIIFIAQNSRKVSLHFFGWHGQFSLALTILLSAVIGVLLVAIPGSARILQLRRALRKNAPGPR